MSFFYRTVDRVSGFIIAMLVTNIIHMVEIAEDMCQFRDSIHS